MEALLPAIHLKNIYQIYGYYPLYRNNPSTQPPISAAKNKSVAIDPDHWKSC